MEKQTKSVVDRFESTIAKTPIPPEDMHAQTSANVDGQSDDDDGDAPDLLEADDERFEPVEPSSIFPEEGEDDQGDGDDGDGDDNDANGDTTALISESSSSGKAAGSKKGKPDAMKFKVLKWVSDQYWQAWLRTRDEIHSKYGDSDNPLIRYMFYAHDILLRLAIEPSHQYVGEGKAHLLYENFASNIHLYAWYGHDNLVKCGVFLMMLIQWWRDVRPDILQVISEYCKWIFDKYIEHHNSVISRFAESRFGPAQFPGLTRLVSMVVQPARRIYDVLASLVFSSTSSGASSADSVRRHHYEADNMSLRSNQQGECAKEYLKWKSPKTEREVEAMCQFIRGRFDYAAQLEMVGDADKHHKAAMDTYRPLEVAKKYWQYGIAVFTKFRDNMHKRERQRQQFEGTRKLRQFLKFQSRKDVLYPLLKRLRWIVKTNYPGIATPTNIQGTVPVLIDKVVDMVLGLPDIQQLSGTMQDDAAIDFLVSVCNTFGAQGSGSDASVAFPVKFGKNSMPAVEPSRRSLWLIAQDKVDESVAHFWRGFEKPKRSRPA